MCVFSFSLGGGWRGGAEAIGVGSGHMDLPNLLTLSFFKD